MVKKFLLTALVSASVLGNAVAQDSSASHNFTVAATISYNSYLNVEAPHQGDYRYGLEAIKTNWNDKKLMVGFEGGMFVTPEIKVNLGGGFNYTYTPGYKNVPGAGYEVPEYSTISSSSKLAYTVFVGADYCFQMGQNLKPFGGIRVKGGQCIAQEKFDEPESRGKSVAEAWTIGASIVGGIDYYFNGGLFIGAQVDVLSYGYGVSTIKPAPGLANRSADSHNFGFLAAPTIKVGFNF